MNEYRPIYKWRKKKKQKGESIWAGLALLGGAFFGAYLWLIILCG